MEKERKSYIEGKEMSEVCVHQGATPIFVLCAGLYLLWVFLSRFLWRPAIRDTKEPETSSGCQGLLSSLILIPRLLPSLIPPVSMFPSLLPPILSSPFLFPPVSSSPSLLPSLVAGSLT